MNYLSKENVQGILELTLLQKQFEQQDKSSALEGGRLLQATSLLDTRATQTQWQTAWDKLIESHVQLRSIFRQLRNQTVQVQLKQRPIPLDFHDVRGQATTEQQAVVEAALTAQRTPFVLAEGPLLRGTIVQISDEQAVLVLTWHAMLFDAQSAEYVVADLRSLLHAVEAGQSWPPLTRQPFKTYVDWLGTIDWTAAQAYWQAELAAFETATALPVDARANERTVRHDAVLDVTLSANVTKRLSDTRRRYGLEPSVLAQAAWGVLLGVYSGTQHVSFGLHVEGRPSKVVGVQSMIAPLGNLLPLVLNVDGGQPVKDYFQQVREKVTHVQSHSFLGLDEIKGYHNFPEQMELFGSTFAVRTGVAEETRVELKGQTFAYPLAVRVSIGEEWQVAFSYASEQLQEATVQGLLNTYLTLLESIADNQAATVAGWNVLTADEQQKLFHEFNQTTLPQPDLSRLVHQVIEAQVEQTPDATAVTCLGEALTYRELNERANALAHWLRSEGFGRNDLAALFAERSIEMLVAILAIFKAGGAYVPLDPAHPDTRIHTILESAGARVIFTEPALAARSVQLADDLAAAPLVFCMQAAPADVAVADVSNLVVYGTDNVPFENEPSDLANVFFTSGSTGLPKGAMIEHIGMLNHLYAKINLLGLNADSVVAQNASHCFDISVWQFVAPLMVGGQVAIYPHEQVAADPSALFRAVQQDQVTVLEMVPAVIEMFLAEADNVRGYHELPWLEYMISTGEGLPVSLCRKWLHTYPHTKVVNTYGATECSDDTSHEIIHTMPEEEQSHIVLGSPIPNFRTYVLDRWQRPVPIGCIGEICLTGVGVGKGYLNDPERTAHAFLRNPFADGMGERMYRTGDLGRYLPNGQLVFISRVDHQVKVRGHRIELGEIESVLLRHETVRQAAAIVRPNAEGENRILAYVVLESVVETSALREALAATVPPYMMPEQLIVLDKMPLNRNDKIDRKALPEPSAADGEQRTVSAPPSTATERVLADIWQEVLGVSLIGIDDNFFSLGGHSLRTIQVRSRLKQTFGLDVSLRTLFDRLTIRDLAAYLDGQQANGGGEQMIPRFPDAEQYPMSQAQQRLFFIYKMDPTSCSYNMPTYMELAGNLHLTAAKRAIETIIERHEALRTTFGLLDGEPVQRVMPPEHVTSEVIDLTHVPADEQRALQEQYQQADLKTPFDLEKGPVFRLKLLKMADDRHVLLANLHHIVSDFWSWDQFFQEFFALYGAYSHGQDNPLPELPIQYRDFAQWQNQRIAQGDFAEMERYWQAQLGGELPVLDLPTDAPRTSTLSQEGASQAIVLDANVVTKIDQLAKGQDVTPFMIFGAAVSAFLARLSGQDDIILGTPEAGRNRMELEGLIGFFINTLPLRTHLEDNPTFIELLGQVKKTALDAVANHELPFNRMVDLVKWDRDTSRTPIFSVMFQVIQQNLHAPPSGLAGTWLPSGLETTNFDLNITFIQRDYGLECQFGYRSALFKAETIQRWMGHFATFLQRLVDAPELPYSHHGLLTESEWQERVTSMVGEVVPVPSDLSMHEAFAAQVERTPDRVAVEFAGQTLTFAELNRKANQVAHHLQACGLQVGQRVGICVERSLEMMVGLFGILKAGGAYVPLDPTYPSERLAYIAEDSGLTVLLTQQHLQNLLPAHQAQVVCLDDTAAFAELPTDNPSVAVTADCVAYVIYTSGSTGKPKGVMVEHRNAINFFAGMDRRIGCDATDTMLAVTSISFDISILELFWTLTRGTKVVLLAEHEVIGRGSNDSQGDDVTLATQAEAHQVTMMQCTPSLMRIILDSNHMNATLRTLQKVLLGGEALPSALAQQILVDFPNVRLFNMYGPTETTIWSAVHEVQQVAGSVPVGRPIANTEFYVLDRHQQLVPLGVPGELYIGGLGVARGYLNRDELTAERFVPHPFAKTEGARLYRTGDLVRSLADGTLEFLGRIDDQVKVRGYRIELGEIEQALLQHRDVREAVVIARADTAGDKNLVAYVVLEAGADVVVSELRDVTKERLPEYMVPNSIMILDQLPLTANGKINRRALPAPERTRQVTNEFVAPRTETERAVAAIWCEVLGVEQVGAFDNFFEIGGHSLKAMAMIDQLKRKLGIHVPIPALFRAPTVAGLSAEFDREVEQAERCLVPLHTGNANVPPLFLVHPQGGGVLSFLELAQELGKADKAATIGSVYGLQAVGYDSDATPLDTVEAMAERYLTEIRTVAPQGPYRLAGWSFGGDVAYEIALRLEATGEQVAFLGMLDVTEFETSDSTYAEVSDENVVKFYAELAGMSPSLIAELSETEALAAIGRFALERNMFHGDVTPDEVHRKMRVMWKCGLAHVRYAPVQHVQTDIHLFLVQEAPPGEARELVDPDRWTKYTAGKLSVIPASGHHHNMVRPPHVARLAEQIHHVLVGTVGIAQPNAQR